MNRIRQVQRSATKKAVVDALIRANGRVVDAAKLLGISRQGTLYWINVFGIDYHSYRIPEPDRSGNSAPYDPLTEQPEPQLLCD